MTRLRSMLHLLPLLPGIIGVGECRAGTDPAAPLGTNLNSVVDFSDEFPFIDLMKGARDWIPGNVAGCFDCREGSGNPACNAPNACPTQIQRDAQGWVSALAAGQVVRSVIHAGNSTGRLAPGQYTLRFSGSGTLQVFGATVVNQQPGQIVVNLASSSNNNFGFNLTALDAGNPIREIQILPPGGICSNDATRFCDAGSPCAGGASCQLYTDPGVATNQRFQPRFLANLAPYRMIRMMDWMETNSSTVVAPADYPTVDSAFWHRVPFAVMAELGNRSGSDLWINVPHLANDAFVDALATTLRDQFRSDRKIYIEYSNENWNGIFSQGREIARESCPGYADLAATCQQDGVPGNGVACDIDPNAFVVPEPAGSACFQALVRGWGDRSVQIFERFDAVFGASARQRLVRVIAAQAANPDLGRQIMVRTVTGQAFSVASRTDAYASAPYFGTEYCQPFEGVNPDTDPAVFASTTAFLDHVETSALNRARGFMTGSRAMLQGNFPNVRHIAYEGGQHLVGVGALTFDPMCNQRFDEANVSPRMQTIYRSYLADWKANGDEFAHFVNVGRWGPFGRWGLLEFQDQDPLSSPKYQAILGHSVAHPCHWSGCSQTGGGPVAPILAYTPAAGNAATPGAGPPFADGPAGTVHASILIGASGAAGGGTTTVQSCQLTGAGAGSFAAPVIVPAGGVYSASVTSGRIDLQCTRGAQPAQAQLACAESANGAPVQNRVWTLQCPAASTSDPVIFGSRFEAGEGAGQCLPAQVLADPSLEATAPDGQSNPSWTSTSTQFGTVFCTTGLCPNDGSNPAPRNGSFFAWFGGFDGLEQSSLNQTLVLPAGAPRHLNLFLRPARSTAPFDSVLEVRLDGTVLRTFTESADTSSDYTVRSVDLSAFTDGSPHQLRLEYRNPSGSGVSSFYVDDLQIDCSAAETGMH